MTRQDHVSGLAPLLDDSSTHFAVDVPAANECGSLQVRVCSLGFKQRAIAFLRDRSGRAKQIEVIDSNRELRRSFSEG